MTRISCLSGVALLWVVGCSGGLETVPIASNPALPIPVSEEPPPVKVTRIPEDPGGACAWHDGRWEWKNRGWEWERGQWVVPPEGCLYAFPVAFWVLSATGSQLYYRPGNWIAEEGDRRCGPPTVCQTKRVVVQQGEAWDDD